MFSSELARFRPHSYTAAPQKTDYEKSRLRACCLEATADGAEMQPLFFSPTFARESTGFSRAKQAGMSALMGKPTQRVIEKFTLEEALLRPMK
jgi:hypothetical protein